MRQQNWDVLAFPKHHPKGSFGLHHERVQKVSAQMYFQQRVMNSDSRFSKDISYIFAAQQFVERGKIESQISIAGRKGVTQTNNGIKKVFLSDVFNFMKTIRGSPKYWKNVSKCLILKLVTEIFKFICIFRLVMNSFLRSSNLDLFTYS